MNSMKLPLDFNVKLYFRLLLPGFLLALGVSPIIFTLIDRLEKSFSYKISYEVAFIVTIMLMGWLIIILDLPINSRWREIRVCNDNACGESKSQNSPESLLDLTFLIAATDLKAPIY
jgi:hypothetical protein